MSEKVEFEVTGAMEDAAAKVLWEVVGFEPGFPDWLAADIVHKNQFRDVARATITAAISHPSFRKQLRAYVAGEMRKVVSNEIGRAPDEDDYDTGYRLGHNEAIRTTLANIAAYEKEQEDA